LFYFFVVFFSVIGTIQWNDTTKKGTLKTINLKVMSTEQESQSTLTAKIEMHDEGLSMLPS